MFEQQTRGQRKGRAVLDVVDGNGLYFARFATAGPYVFMSSTAVGTDGRLAKEAIVEPPYHLSPTADVVNQARYIYDLYTRGLPTLGSSLDQMLQVEQFIPRKVYANGYINVRSTYIGRLRPTTALLATGELTPAACVIAHTGIALAPNEADVKEIVTSTGGGDLSPDWGPHRPGVHGRSPYNDVVAAGSYVFVTGDVAVDPATQDIDTAVKVPRWIWLGSEIGNEAEFLLTRLEKYLDRAGASLADLVHTTIYLTDISDLFELDQVWRRRFPEAPAGAHRSTRARDRLTPI